MKVRAAVLARHGGPLHIETLDVRNLAATDVLVRLASTSVCHTDVEAIDGQFAAPVPLVPGHEGAGRVEWVGPAVRQLRVGDPVVLSWNPHCSGCFYCQRDQPILCAQYTGHASRALHFDGTPRLYRGTAPVHQLMYAGTFAECAVVTEGCAVKIPQAMPLDLACLIGCGVMTGVGAALYTAKVQPGDTLTVLGCGAVGLSALQGARMADAERIIAVDRDPARLALAMRFGATDTLLADEHLLEAHAALTLDRGADAVIEAAGNGQAFRTSLELVRPGGRLVWLGKLPPQQDVALRWGSLMGEKHIVRSSYGGARPQRDFPMLAHAYLEGRLLLDEYVTRRITLADINAGVDGLRSGHDLRALVQLQAGL
jgi:S-(hydroxymethyl)glutathione dehydrogenase/alcohol dehydrogenase